MFTIIIFLSHSFPLSCLNVSLFVFCFHYSLFLFCSTFPLFAPLISLSCPFLYLMFLFLLLYIMHLCLLLFDSSFFSPKPPFQFIKLFYFFLSFNILSTDNQTFTPTFRLSFFPLRFVLFTYS